MLNNIKPKTALIVGASGLVGEHLLALLLASSHYDNVIAIVRTPLSVKHVKLKQLTVDFSKLEEELVNQCNSQLCLTSVNHVFCTLGTTIKKAGSKRAFYQVDHDYPLAIAKFFHQHGASLFAIVSAIGADKQAKVFYNQVKGEVETSLGNIGYQQLGIFRPSMLAGNRKEFRFGEYLGSIVMNLFAFLLPKKYHVIASEKVANAMLAFAIKSSTGTTIIESDQLQNH